VLALYTVLFLSTGYNYPLSSKIYHNTSEKIYRKDVFDKLRTKTKDKQTGAPSSEIFRIGALVQL